VLLGAKGKRVNVNRLLGNVGVMGPWLHETVVRTITDDSAVVAVKLDLGVSTWLNGEEISDRESVSSNLVCAWSLDGSDSRVLEYPDKLLDGVVEVHADIVGRAYGRSESFSSCELKLIDEVLMRHLGETATLLGIEVNVVNEKLGTKISWGIG